ncbi:MAG: hypothetical protein ACYCQJ_01785 [Nitrososphaerales archaeon]
MPRFIHYVIIAIVIALIVFVAYFVITNNQLGKPCPASGCSTVNVSGGVSFQGKVFGIPSEVIFTSSSGQNFNTVVIINGNSGSYSYLINLPNYQNYTVSIKSGLGSCSAGNLDLNSKYLAMSWNAFC